MNAHTGPSSLSQPTHLFSHFEDFPEEVTNQASKLLRSGVYWSVGGGVLCVVFSPDL